MRQLLPVQTVPPAVDLVEVAIARKQCRIDHTDDDDLLRGIVAAVTQSLEAPAGILRVCLHKQTWREAWSEFPTTCRIPLSIEPLVSVTSVQYVAAGDTAWTTFASENWIAYSDAQGGWVELADGISWPDTATRPEAVRVTYQAGYTPTQIPQAIVQAARLMVGHYYENREAIVVGVPAQELPLGVKTLLSPFLRVPG